MKNPRLKINRKMRITGARKFKQELKEIVGDCLEDIRYYIVDDLMKYMKKRGILYAKTPKKNKKTKKNKR